MPFFLFVFDQTPDFRRIFVEERKKKKEKKRAAKKKARTTTTTKKKKKKKSHQSHGRRIENEEDANETTGPTELEESERES